MKKLTMLVIVGALLTIGAVAAQQQQQPPPPASADQPADKTGDRTTDKTNAVLAALKGNGPAVAAPPATDTPLSLTTVLDR